jgi:hypothetical protein
VWSPRCYRSQSEQLTISLCSARAESGCCRCVLLALTCISGNNAIRVFASAPPTLIGDQLVRCWVLRLQRVHHRKPRQLDGPQTRNIFRAAGCCDPPASLA